MKTISKDTQSLLDDMMKQSGLTAHQQRRLRSEMSTKGQLPLRCNPTDSGHDGAAMQKKKHKKAINVPRPVKRDNPAPPVYNRTGVKMRETMVKEGLFKEDTYRPSPSTGPDYAKQKRQLQYYMMLDGDQSLVELAMTKRAKAPKKAAAKRGEEEISDSQRFAEIIKEIEDRRQFLDDIADMKGDLKTHGPKIRAEISQYVREMEDLDARMKKATLKA